MRWYQFLQKTSSWTAKQKQDYQTRQVRSIITHAYHHVPYYHHLMRKLQLTPTDFNVLTDLEKLPVLTKETIRSNTDAYKADNFPTSAFYPRYTGGTTGIPLQFYLEKARWMGVHFAFNKVYMSKAGYRGIDRVISFSGIPQQVRFHHLYRTVELSSLHTTTQDFSRYHEIFLRFKPRFVTSFPSMLLLFSRFLQENGKTVPEGITGIFCHGEKLYPHEKKFLSELYDCDVFDQYGHREQCVFATTCSQDDQYHIYPEYGYVELVDSQNKSIMQKGKTGEIIATSLTNTVFPFIRYKTGDLSQFIFDDCVCGMSGPSLKQILGRTQEYLIGKNDEKIPLTGLYHVLADPQFHIKEYQIKQKRKGHLIISFVKKPSFTDKNLKKMTKHMETLLGDSFTIHFQPVGHITRLKDGKYQYLIQHLTVDHHEER